MSEPWQNPRERQKVLFIHMAALGDAIMASPALRLLKQNLPEWSVAVLARSHACDYFQRLPYVDEVIPFIHERHVSRKKPWLLLGARGELLTLGRRLRAERFTATLQWRGQIPDTMVTILARARHRVLSVQNIHRRSVLPAERMPLFFTDITPVKPADAHMVEAMAAPARFLLEKLGRHPQPDAKRALDYPLHAADHSAADAFREEHGLREGEPFALVGISAKTLVNAWPLDRFAAVADSLQDRHGLRVVLTALPEHTAREEAVARAMNQPPIRSTGKISFGGLCALLSQARLLVALNTGLSHVAAALGVPVVVLSGRDGASLTPWASPHRVVTRNSFYPRRHPDERQWASLVPLITAEEVIQAADELLNESHARSR